MNNITGEVRFQYAKPVIWFSIPLIILVAFISWGIARGLDLKEEIMPWITPIIMISTIAINILSFYYNFKAVNDKLDYDKEVAAKKEALESALSTKNVDFHGVIGTGITQNLSLLEKNIELLEKRIKVHDDILDRRLDYDKKVCALDIISAWHSDLEVKARIWRTFMDDWNSAHHQKGYLTVSKEIDRQERERREGQETIKDSLKPILNYFEKASLAMEQGIADETTLKLYFKDIFILYYHNLQLYIKDIQSGQNGAPHAYSGFIVYAKRWLENKA